MFSAFLYSISVSQLLSYSTKISTFALSHLFMRRSVHKKTSCRRTRVYAPGRACKRDLCVNK
nr:MAG TPA: hypothetical protein [Caudoviricetes sp.]